jgi:hypothetical protein
VAVKDLHIYVGYEAATGGGQSCVTPGAGYPGGPKVNVCVYSNLLKVEKRKKFSCDETYTRGR